MQVTKITYSRVFNLHNGEHETIGLEAVMEQGDHPWQGLVDLKDIADRAHAGQNIDFNAPVLQREGLAWPSAPATAEQVAEDLGPEAGAPSEDAGQARSVEETMLEGFEACTTREDLAILVAPHAELLRDNPELQAAYDRKLAELSPGTLAPKAEKAKRSHKKKAEDLPADAAPSAEAEAEPEEEEATAEATATAAIFQPLDWFTARVGRTVWMQGADETKYTGCYLIETPDYPEWMMKYQEDEAFTFRDATQEEIAAHAEPATA